MCLRFEDFKLSKSDDTRWARIKMLALLKKDAKPKETSVVSIKLPQACLHTGPNHLVSVETSFTHRTSSVVKDKIYEIVAMGITSVPIVRKMLRFDCFF